MPAAGRVGQLGAVIAGIGALVRTANEYGPEVREAIRRTSPDHAAMAAFRADLATFRRASAAPRASSVERK